MDLATRMERFRDSDLYVVITEAFCGGRPGLEVLEACLEAGVRVVQFREKDLDDSERYQQGLAFRARTREADALLIVDDRLDLALAVGADGVHLGRLDLPIEAARRIAPTLVIGASTHNLGEALVAQDAGASYINIGPIFPTRTKAVPTGAVAPEMIEVIAPFLRVPFTCMGGITADNVHEVLQRGARHVAVVTAVTAAPDIRAAAATLRTAIQDARSTPDSAAGSV
ncbi:MAG TPA: thiamine phosphate synthase [Candidatus Hydrogenedentes bacterium]|nr:thiamine phosphate synthase [Candidatus Hydrogenedentota bacterium]HNT87282.1 thiamine phosphate synthase [Candidatus Hydrogenedentota bacterium]